MFKLIIAEDESVTREAIERSIDFRSLGFDLIASCSDGTETWEAYKKYKPDLIITDINMPGMTGLELAKKIHLDSEPCRVVILTGYDRFDFVRQALSFSVSDYLLKPVTPSEMRAMLVKSREILELETKKKAAIESLSSRYYYAEKLAEHQILNLFIAGNSEACEAEMESGNLVKIKSMLKELNRQSCFAVSLLSLYSESLKINEARLSSREALFMLTNLGEELSLKHQEIYVFPDNENRAVALYAGKDERAEAILKSFVSEWIKIFHGLTGLRGQGAVSRIKNKESIFEAAAEAGKGLSFAESTNAMKCLSYSDYAAYIKNDKNKTELTERNAGNASAFEEKENAETDFENISPGDIVVAARAYIDKHFCDPDLTLDFLSRYFSISMSYLSTVFKNNTGLSFVEYLTDVRIKEAKKLLKDSSLMLYEIAESVGYDSPAYFTYVFKKHTGGTPKEYRRLFAVKN